MRKIALLSIAAVTGLAAASHAAITMTPMTTFGGGDGWMAPGEVTWLTTDNNQRSLAVNPATGNLLVVNGLSVRVASPVTGIGTGLLDTTGVAGGARALNTIGATSDGVIYGTNLTTATAATGTNQFKVYRWAGEAAAPTNTYAGDAGLVGARIGDGMDVGGTDASGYVASGFGTNAALAGTNGFATVSTGAVGNANAVSFTGTPPNSGDFRLSIAAVDGNTLYGTQSSGATGRLRQVDFAGSSGTLNASIQLSSASERAMDYAEYTYNATSYKLLATIDTVSSLVRVYDVSGVTGATTSLVPLASLNNTSGTLTANGNASGGVAFGALTPLDGTSASIALYAMSTNQGIQAFNVVIPEPTTLTALAGLGVLFGRRRK